MKRIAWAACFSSALLFQNDISVLGFSPQRVTPSHPQRPTLQASTSSNPIPRQKQQHRDSFSRSRKLQINSPVDFFRKRKIYTSVMRELDTIVDYDMTMDEAIIRNSCRDILQQPSLSPSHLSTMILSIEKRMTNDDSVSIPLRNAAIQVTALAGHLPIALDWVRNSLLEQGMAPTITTQVALGEALRRCDKTTCTEQQQAFGALLDAFQQANVEPSLWLYNAYLAMLVRNTTITRNRRGTGSSVVSQLVEDHIVQKTVPWRVAPDVVTYNTLLHAAAVEGNQTCVRLLWKDLLLQQQQASNGNSEDLQPNMVTYNARLRSVAEDAAEVLRIWDEEIRGSPQRGEKDATRLRADRYTIDFLLLPMLKSGREQEFYGLLDSFLERSSAKVGSHVLSALLITLVSHDSLDIAQTLWTSYVHERGLVESRTRHYNILLEGYKGTLGTVDHHAIQHDAMEQAWGLYQSLEAAPYLRPDAYTLSTMSFLCRNATELSTLLYSMLDTHMVRSNEAALRTALRCYGSFGDPSSALWLLSMYAPKSIKTWNMLLICLADSAIKNSVRIVHDPSQSELATLFANATCPFPREPAVWLLENEWPMDIFQLVRFVLDDVCDPSSPTPFPNSQTFGAAARGLQISPTTDAVIAAELFANATALGVSADGRFVNAVLRCCGNNLAAAVSLWKGSMRSQCIAHCRTVPWAKKQNLRAVYNGLLYVSGRAFRPDIALRFIYALSKEGIEPDEGCLNSYRAGCRDEDRQVSPLREGLMAVHESLLLVECAKYDQRDRKRHGEKRVRIILPSK